MPTTEEPDDGLSVQILRAAFEGVTRAEDFQARLGAAQETVDTALEALVDAGFLERETSRNNRHRQYVLVDRGECYRNVLSSYALSGETS